MGLILYFDGTVIVNEPYLTVNDNVILTFTQFSNKIILADNKTHTIRAYITGTVPGGWGGTWQEYLYLEGFYL